MFSAALAIYFHFDFGLYTENLCYRHWLLAREVVNAEVTGSSPHTPVSYWFFDTVMLVKLNPVSGTALPRDYGPVSMCGMRYFQVYMLLKMKHFGFS